MAGHHNKGQFSTDPVNRYIIQHSIKLTSVQQELIDETIKRPDAEMIGAVEVVQLNSNLIKLIKARKVLDIGVFTGLSSLTAAMALPDGGKLYGLDISNEVTKIARKYWAKAGVESKIELHLAPASETLQKFIDEGHAGTFDYAFIDADKNNYDEYYEKCLKLMHPGSIIAIDNTLWSHRVLDESDQSSFTSSIRNLNKKLSKDDRIDISFLRIGDGFTLCFVK